MLQQIEDRSWKGRINPASGNPLTEELSHWMIGRDLPRSKRQRDGFRRRIPRTLPKVLEPTTIQQLIDTALRDSSSRMKSRIPFLIG
jgi:hypothetical protein